MALTVAGLATFAQRAHAQTTTVQLNYTNVWKYNASGTELGAAWRTNTYDDSPWASGPGLLGADDGGVAPYLAIVPTGFGTPITLSQTVTTYYFRTTFTLQGSPSATGLQLIATNLIDDGGAIWLNGRLAGTIRMPTTFNAATGATGGPTDGQTDTMFLTNWLRSGVNTLAVEVHQPATASGDMVWGMKLVTVVPSALTITSQPESQTVFVGESVTLSVGVSGGPVSYRWLKDGNSISPSATNSTFSISSAALSSSGAYRVIVSNAVTVVTSQVAQLTVVEDTLGPKMVSAIIDEGAVSNRITIRFDETVLTTAPPTQKNSPINPSNYRLVSTADPSYALSITNVRRSGLQVSLEIGDPAWDPKGSYYLVVNNVADRFTNSINPNSVIGVSVPVTENLAQMSGIWSYYDCADAEFCDPNSASVYANEAFAKTNFVIDPLRWKTGNGIFVKESGLGEIAPCTGDTRGSFISFQLEPTLFRRTFTMPANASSNGTLRLRQMFDDGYILYLNGRPIYSNNCVGPIAMTSRAAGTEVGDAVCQTNPVSIAVNNLRPGTNWLAAAVVQHPVNHQADTVFGIELDLVSLQTGQAPTNRPPGTPRIAWTRQVNQFVLSWPATNYGYALMYSTNIAGTGPRPDKNWLTNEVNWTQVKDQANPYTNAIPPTTGPRRFYKLFREKLND